MQIGDNGILVKRKGEKARLQMTSNKRSKCWSKKVDSQTQIEDMSEEYQEFEKGLWGQNLVLIKSQLIINGLEKK